jgi:penicillin amidase
MSESNSVEERVRETGSRPRAPKTGRRWARRIGLGMVLALAVAVGLAFWRLQAALPDTTGTIRVAGLRAPAEILRDKDEVPHIRAASVADALFALGYVHAQERLWQMEVQRRVAQGRLAEVLGPPALKTDRLLRTIGLQRAARDAWAHLDGNTRGMVESYIAGINAFLADHLGGSLPIEFALLRVTPEPWRGEDVVAWQKTMGWLLSMNWEEELLRVKLEARVGAEAARQLTPAYTANGPIIVPGEPEPVKEGARTTVRIVPPMAPGPDARPREALVRELAELGAAVRDLPFMPHPGGGSNNWVVAGSRSVSGKPILANDPHLGGQAPGIWFLAHISGGDLDAIGATLPGAPGIIIGHNRRIAWGNTALLADVEDLYVEHVNAADQAEYNGAWEPMTVIRDVIKVRGERDVAVRVRLTRHGPLVSDVLETPGEALALRWTGYDAEDDTAECFLKVDTARSWDEFVSGLARFRLPIQNFVYADVDGNIGYFAPGAIPVRAGGGDGTTPVPGWTDANEWRGYVHDSEWPKAFNPPRGYIATANNKAVSDSYPFVIGTSFEPAYRVARITELIEATPKLAVDDMARIQRDVRSAQVQVVLPFLLRARPLDSKSREAMERLAKWDGTIAGESADAALYEAWYAAAVRRIFSDEIGDDLWADYVQHRSLVAKALDRVIQTRDAVWCDDVRTREPESCETILGESLVTAIEDESARQGTSNVANWRLDRVNAATFPHLPFDRVSLLRRFFSRTVPRGGDSFTVTPTMPVRDQIFVSSYRQIIDLASFDQSRFMMPMGQSGYVWSSHYADMLDRWARVEYIPMRFSAAAVDEAVSARLVLEPK